VVRIFPQNRYFTRLWIVQEVRLAPEIRIIDDDKWEAWTTVAGFVTRRKFRTTNITPAEWLLHDLQVRSSFSLKDLIIQFAGMQCQDPKDNVYGLLGLVEE
jgi:hypothetical protein